mmetsp:Transcript_251/g.803  ORF Transcript_251/g.803 Transcript_251/m.803 type:complete len:203 (+) Transcript_251:38-646(+)
MARSNALLLALLAALLACSALARPLDASLPAKKDVARPDLRTLGVTGPTRLQRHTLSARRGAASDANVVTSIIFNIIDMDANQTAPVPLVANYTKLYSGTWTVHPIPALLPEDKALQMGFQAHVGADKKINGTFVYLSEEHLISMGFAAVGEDVMAVTETETKDAAEIHLSEVGGAAIMTVVISDPREKPYTPPELQRVRVA